MIYNFTKLGADEAEVGLGLTISRPADPPTKCSCVSLPCDWLPSPPCNLAMMSYDIWGTFVPYPRQKFQKNCLRTEEAEGSA